MSRASDVAVEYRRKAFVLEYVTNGFNGTEAAKAAGYRGKSAGQKLLGEPDVQAMIREVLDKQLSKQELKAEDVLEQLLYAVTRTVDDFVDEEGMITTDTKKLNKRAKACIDGIEQTVTELYSGSGDNIGRRIQTKLKFVPKMPAIELAMTYLRLIGKDKEDANQKPGLDWGSVLESPDAPDEIEDRIREMEQRALPDKSSEGKVIDV